MNEFLPPAGWTALGVVVTAIVGYAGLLLTRRSKSDDHDLAVMQASLARVDADLQRLQVEMKEMRTEQNWFRRIQRYLVDHASDLRAQLRRHKIEPVPVPDELKDIL